MDEHGKPLIVQALRERRRRLEAFTKKYLKKSRLIRLSPMTCDLSIARKWFHMGIGLDGIIAKREDLPYQSGNRTGMLKIKKQRAADCVVGGFRYLEMKKQIGSLLLGLYNDQGLLDHVGFSSSIRNEDRQQLTKKLVTIVKPPFTGKAPGGSAAGAQNTRWSGSPWIPNSSRRCNSITSPAGVFGTARSSCGGALKRIHDCALWSRFSERIVPRSIYFEVVARLRLRMLALASFASFGGLQPCRSPVRMGT